MKIYLGIYQIKHAQFAPQFMFSFNRLKNRISSTNFNNYDWIMDSGAFSELSLNGKYTYTLNEYLCCVELHQPKMFFNMDYMCESSILKKTKLTIKDHQEKTIENQIKILDLLENYNIIGNFSGCIQGWEINDYIKHIDMLKDYGLIENNMGVGSICRRHSEIEILNILQAIKKELPNVKLHGFGIKTNTLKNPIIHECLNSCDSMAWSFAGRYDKKLCINCEYPKVKNCANCYQYMLKWYKKLENISNKSLKQKTFFKL